MPIVDDHFIDQETSESIKNFIFSNTSGMPWFFNENTNVEDPQRIYCIGTDKTRSSFQMVSPVEPSHPLYNTIVGLLNVFAAKHGFSYNSISRIKINLIPRDPDFTMEYHHMPHIDSDGEHQVFIYYVNDSDGDTILFDDFFNGQTPKLESFERISPKQGRGMVFNGLQYHASSSPCYSKYRCIINVDFE